VRLSAAEYRKSAGWVYAHKDMNQLEDCLKRASSFAKRMVVTDGVFSMDGDIAPLKEIVELCEKYDALVMVDDAHASGVLGKNGAGTTSHFDLYGRVDIQLGTLSRFGEGDVIEDVGFEGRGCAISQAATSMLTDIVKGRTAEEVATMPKDELLEEIGIPLTPVRLKCALLGLGVLKVALHNAKGTPIPDEWGTSSGEIDLS
jgi:NifU-like protein involved in Fe-S cluster formation